MAHTLRAVQDANVLLSPFILDELRCVLPTLINRHGLTSTEMDDLVDVRAIQAEVIEAATGQDAALHNANAPPVLGTLLAAQAGEGEGYLITGDKDLLALAGRYPFVTPAVFWAAHGGGVGGRFAACSWLEWSPCWVPARDPDVPAKEQQPMPVEQRLLPIKHSSRTHGLGRIAVNRVRFPWTASRC